MQLLSNGQPNVRFSTTSDREGRYELRRVPAGTYTVAASKGGYAGLQYGQTHTLEPPRNVVVRDAQIVSGVDLVLPRGAVIAGRIVDEQSEPVPDAVVLPMRQTFERGRSQMRPVSLGWTQAPIRTNDLGEFRLSGLPPGIYYVAATLSGAFTNTIEDQKTFAYARTFHPGTARTSEAEPIVVQSGGEQFVTFSLVPSVVVQLAGRVVNSRGSEVAAGVARLSRTGDFWAQTIPLTRDGTFTVTVPALPGAYTMTAITGAPGPTAGRGSRELGMVSFSIADGDLTDLLITTSPGATVTGRVVLEDAPPNSTSELPPLRVSALSMETEDIGQGAPASVTADGRFELHNVFGRSLIAVGLLRTSPWSVQGIYQDGIEISDLGVDVNRPARGKVVIVLTQQRTEVSGVVTSGDRPDGKATVVLFAREETKWSHPLGRYVSITRTDDGGRYSLAGLPVGDYLAVAVHAAANESLTNPSVLRELRSGAVAVTLGIAERKNVSLAVAAP